MHTDTLLWKVSKLYGDYGTLDYQPLFQATNGNDLNIDLGISRIML